MSGESANSITISFKERDFSISLDELSQMRARHLEAARQSVLTDTPVATSVDKEWFRENVPCRRTCPSGTNARGYVMAIDEGRYQEAYLIARRNNPFVAVCAKVCGAPCESACQRGKVDEAVSIRGLKDFAVKNNHLSTGEVYRWIRQKMGKVKPAVVKRESPKLVPARMAIIGAGPAGLSAAHDLILMGYEVTLYEAGSNPGGMPANALPFFRLDREAVRKDVESILSLPIKLKLNQACGKDFSLDQLKEEFGAVLIAVGLQKGRGVPVPGMETPGVLSGLDFLMDVGDIATDRKFTLGEKVVVIGGGCVATDVARAAMRIDSTSEVHLVCLEAMKGCRPDNLKEEMPAWIGDVVDASEEGIIMNTSWGPKRVVVGQDGRVAGLEVINVIDVYDSEGRFNPTFVPGTERIIECDNILLAVGQAPDMSFLDGSQGFELNQRKMLKVDPVTLATSKPGVYACGDILGPGLVINAVASGQLAAQSMHEYLGGVGSLGLSKQEHMEAIPITWRFERFYYGLSLTKQYPTLRPPEERLKGWEASEIPYSEYEAQDQAGRCLNCNVSPVIGQRQEMQCILCGGCVDVCPTRALAMAYLDGSVVKEFSLWDGAGGDGPWVGLTQDEELCIHCGLCSYRCPVDAISMVKFEEIL
ncbi:MAG: FAD-dependent oxidoreductase [Candidatus Brocadiales bacterium]|nr:FAD-dependent oxidoreductase [Candidatus Bathyanammoxibius sp.]